MLDYSLCRQTVTVYRLEGDTLCRTVVDGCLYDYEDLLTQDASGCRMERRFLLVMPGSVQRVFPGDRVYDGIGPEEVDWSRFLPVNVPGLAVAEYAHVCRWGGEVCHTEAGRK